MIDWQNNVSRAWSDTHVPLTDYADKRSNILFLYRKKWDVWAEAAMVYVFGHYDGNGIFVDNTGEAIISGKDLTVQMNDMQRVLEGW